MTKLFCDKCKQEIKPGSTIQTTKRIRLLGRICSNDIVTDNDLCGICANKLIEWLSHE